MKNNKFTIAVDVDCVLNNLIERTIKVYNERYDASLTINNFKEYDVFKCLPHTAAQNFVDLFLEEDLWASLVPIKDAQWAIKHFVDSGYNIYLATATHHTNFAWKVEWLKHYFGMVPEKNIICIHNKGLLKVDVLIDDCIDHLLSSMWYERVTLNYPWNNNIHDEVYGIHRAHNWIEIVDIVNEIYEKSIKE